MARLYPARARPQTGADARDAKIYTVFKAPRDRRGSLIARAISGTKIR
jgi:hypothetical protein